MNETVLINQHYVGYNGKKALYDYFPASEEPKRAVLFIHGYMGFKDWGCWNLVAEHFRSQGITFAKANLSRNGTSLERPTEFTDLDSFGKNTYSIELHDIHAMIDQLRRAHGVQQVDLIGHSRGGGMVLLASDHRTVRTVSCWAPISSIEERFPSGEDWENWQETGVYFKLNGRTGQEMPHLFEQWTDFDSNRELLSIESACSYIRKPVLLIHGGEDTSVTPDNGFRIANWTSRELNLIEGAGHTFGAAHPWNKKSLPSHLSEVCRLTSAFLLSNLNE